MQSGQIASLNNEPFGWMGAQSPHFLGNNDGSSSLDPASDSLEPPGTPSFHSNDPSSPPGSAITSPEHLMSKDERERDRERGGSNIQVGRFKVTTSTVAKTEDRPRSGASTPTSMSQSSGSILASYSKLPTHSAIPMEEDVGNLRNNISTIAPTGGMEQQVAFLVQQSQMQQKMLAQLLDNKLGFGGSLTDSSEKENPLVVISNLERLVSKLMKENEELKNEVTRLKQNGGERTEEERKRDLLLALQNWKTQPHDVRFLFLPFLPLAFSFLTFVFLGHSVGGRWNSRLVERFGLAATHAVNRVV
jgi:hypothetical protein